MEILTEDGPWEIHPTTKQEAENEDKYSSTGEKDGKDNYGCKLCPYNIESATKAAIKRHITIKHAIKVSSPRTRSGTKRKFEETDGENEDTAENRPQVGKV